MRVSQFAIPQNTIMAGPVFNIGLMAIAA